MSRNDASSSNLKDIRVDLIDRNEENPRLIFRSSELDELLNSIQQYGIQVPISVYRQKDRYVLIDGERRWRCAQKLNLKEVPALVQNAPSALNNLLLMFNIHALREQWDLLTIAMKLPKVMALIEEEHGKQPTEQQISVATGLGRGVIRRCRVLVDLPNKYKQTILKELTKPKSEQRLTEDFFIEMERALKTVENAMPGTIPSLDEARNVIIRKYKNKTINNIVQLRDLPKIARAERVHANSNRAAIALRRFFEEPSYTIEDAYQSSVGAEYSERDLLVRLRGLLERLQTYDNHVLDGEVRQELSQLVRIANRLLKS